MNILTEICARKRDYIARRKAQTSLEALKNEPLFSQKTRGFKQALETKIKQGKTGLIAEIKKASPSGGLIRADFNPATLGVFYERGGAACLSVLTDEPYFQGRDAYLAEARLLSALPILRKDFMLDPYQMYESRALGADCVLLIMAALTDNEAKTLEETALTLGMDVLVEVHDHQELERAIKYLSPQMIGINNRDLKTLKVDLATSETLAKDLPSHILAVCESGIRTHADIERIKKVGISCFLVGESLMREDDVEMATKQLLNG